MTSDDSRTPSYGEQRPPYLPPPPAAYGGGRQQPPTGPCQWQQPGGLPPRPLDSSAGEQFTQAKAEYAVQ